MSLVSGLASGLAPTWPLLVPPRPARAAGSSLDGGFPEFDEF